MSAPINGVYTYTDETGATQTIDTNANSNPYDNTTSGLVATDVQAAIDEINAAAGTVALVDNGDGTYDFTDAGGNTTTISDTSISTMSAPVNGVYTYTDETGATQTIDTNANSNPYDNTTSGLVATDVQAAIDEINAAAGTVALVDNGDGTYDFTDAGGNTTTITDTSISTLVDNGDGSFNYTAENGTVTIFTETLTALVDNANGTFTYTNEDGVAQTINKSDVIDNFDGTYVFTNNDGSNVTLDTNAGSNPYDNSTSGLTATDVQAAIDELNTGSTDDQNISGSVLTGTDLTIGIENGTSEDVDLSSLVETVIAGTGAITVTDDGNGNYTVNSTDPDEDLTNELTLIGTGVPAVTPSNSGVTYVDDAAGQLYVYDGSVWIAVGGSSSPDLDGDPTNEQNTGFAVNGANLEITDSGGTLTVPISSLGTDDQIANEVNITDAGGNFTATEVEGALAELAAGSTDDQNIESLGLSGANVLTVGIEDGTSQTVDLSALDDSGTDDQNIESLGVDLGTNVLTVGIEDGTSQTVDLSHLDDSGTDDQIANEVNITDVGGNFTATEVEGALAELAAGSTDDQNIESLGLSGANVLTVGIEDGT
ncbi:MAG: hypothetical protein WBM76_17595, partial [Woeseiaceae bacterium]